MNGNNIKILAERVRGIGRELLAIANQLDAQAPHLAVQLPPRDLFSDIFGESPLEDLDNLTVRPKEETPEAAPAKAQRHYQRNAKRMEEHLAVASSDKLGRAQGFCARNDIERSIARITGRSREDVRDAVNRIAQRMQITCVKSRSYRYYPKSLRNAIVNAACEELARI